MRVNCYLDKMVENVLDFENSPANHCKNYCTLGKNFYTLRTSKWFSIIKWLYTVKGAKILTLTPTNRLGMILGMKNAARSSSINHVVDPRPPGKVLGMKMY